MAKFGLKSQIFFILFVTLALAMFLQSCILLFIGLRTSIKDDVRLAKMSLKEKNITVCKGELDSSFDEFGKTYDKNGEELFFCTFIEINGKGQTASSSCRYKDKLNSISRTAQTNKSTAYGFAGEGWKSYFGGGETVLLSVPLINDAGEVFGSISAERSLSHVYSQFHKEMVIALCYLIVNLVIFGTIGFLRFSHIFFRPLEKLVKTADNYHPDNQSLIPFRDDESAFRKLSISLNDLLDRVERDNRSLRKMVDELEAANRALKEKNELVIRSERLASTGRLSAGLAHEICNPLTIIQGYVELLGREDLSSTEKLKFSTSAQQELDRIKSLIRQLLDFSRPLPPAKEIVGVSALISEVLSFVSVEKAFADIRVQTHFHAEREELLTDRNALRQVLINVLLNAMDATADAKNDKEICIATSNVVKGSDAVLSISIQDNGVGITEENLKHVFDPFYTTKEVGRGTGLGLFVCYTIIDRMGGSIEIVNRPATGIDVKIELPLLAKDN